MPAVRRALLLSAALVLPFIATATANQTRDVTGTYESNWDDVSLVQRGDRVTGTYVCCGGGTIEGRVIEGRVIKYSWHQPGGSGRGVWTIDGSRIEGTWGSDASETDGGRWDLVRARTASTIAN